MDKFALAWRLINIYVFIGDKNKFQSLLNLEWKKSQYKISEKSDDNVIRMGTNIKVTNVENDTSEILSTTKKWFFTDFGEVISEGENYRIIYLYVPSPKDVDAVYTGEVDLLFTDIHNITFPTFQMSHPIYDVRVGLFMRRPGYTIEFTSYVNAFTPQLVVTGAAVIALVSVMIKLIDSWSPSAVAVVEALQVPESYTTYLFSTLGGILNQDYQVEIRSFAAKIAMLTSIIFGFLLYSAWSAVLTSQLTDLSYKLPISSITDAAEQNMYYLCVRKESARYQQFTLSNSTTLQEQWSKVVNNGDCPTTNFYLNLRDKICKQKLVYMDSMAIFTEVQKLPNGRNGILCPVTMAPEVQLERGPAFIMRGNYKWKDRINAKLIQISETGIMHYLRLRWIHPQLAEDLPPKTVQPVEMRHVIEAFMFFIYISFLSVVILVIEIVIHKLSNRAQNI